MLDTTRLGDWTETASGQVFWPLDPRPEEIHIADIAHALSNMCRYAGHCRKFYSVAQHSYLVSRQVEPRHQLWGLLHDASEAYLVDVPRPLKPHLTNYFDIEARLMSVIAEKFGLDPTMPDEVKRVDGAILLDEKKALMPNSKQDWGIPFEPLGIEIESWSPAYAKNKFLEMYHILTH